MGNSDSCSQASHDRPQDTFTELFFSKQTPAVATHTSAVSVPQREVLAHVCALLQGGHLSLTSRTQLVDGWSSELLHGH